MTKHEEELAWAGLALIQDDNPDKAALKAVLTKLFAAQPAVEEAPTTLPNVDVERAVAAAARFVIEAVAGALQEDPHQWSTRPCSTCRTVSGLLGRPFGCYLYAQQRAQRAQKASP